MANVNPSGTDHKIVEILGKILEDRRYLWDGMHNVATGRPYLEPREGSPKQLLEVVVQGLQKELPEGQIHRGRSYHEISLCNDTLRLKADAKGVEIFGPSGQDKEVINLVAEYVSPATKQKKAAESASARPLGLNLAELVADYEPYLSKVLEKEVEELAAALPGARNYAANKMAFSLARWRYPDGSYCFSEDQITDLVLDGSAMVTLRSASKRGAMSQTSLEWLNRVLPLAGWKCQEKQRR